MTRDRSVAFAGGVLLFLAALVGTGAALEGASRARCARIERALDLACHYEGGFPTARIMAKDEAATLLARLWPLHARRLRELRARIDDFERKL